MLGFTKSQLSSEFFQSKFPATYSHYRKMQSTKDSPLLVVVHNFNRPCGGTPALVSELTHARKHHRNIKGIGGGNHLVVAL